MTISSPCTKICVIESGICAGCGRTLDEIARWGSMSETARRDIMALLPARIMSGINERTSGLDDRPNVAKAER